jgi:hypothetical protein
MTTPEPDQETPPAPPRTGRRRNRRLLRYFFLQLVPVTAGILIALTIDGLLELRRQDKLVAEAHAAIAAEIADNARALDNALPSIDTFIASIMEAQAAITEILATGTTTRTEFNWNMIAPGLDAANRSSTAARSKATIPASGAAKHLYREVPFGHGARAETVLPHPPAFERRAPSRARRREARGSDGERRL